MPAWKAFLLCPSLLPHLPSHPHSLTKSTEVQLLSPFKQPTKNARQHMPCQCGHKSLSFLSCTSAQILLNRHLAGRAQMWQYGPGDLGRSLWRKSQKRVWILLCTLLTLLLVPFKSLTIYGIANNPIRAGKKVFKLYHWPGMWVFWRLFQTNDSLDRTGSFH